MTSASAVPAPIVEFVMPLNNEQKMLAALERIEVLLTKLIEVVSSVPQVTVVEPKPTLKPVSAADLRGMDGKKRR